MPKIRIKRTRVHPPEKRFAIGSKIHASRTKVAYSRYRSSKTDIIPPSVKSSLRRFQDELVGAGIPRESLMVVGAVANVFYGRPRLSRDVDVAVVLIGEDREKALLSISNKHERYSMIYPDKRANRDEPDLKSTVDLSKVNLIKLRDKDTDVIIDILLVKSNQNQYGIDPSSFARSREVSLGDDEGTRISIPSPEDFIMMKLTSRRPLTQDYQDMFLAK